jgi:hypothetical protein
MRMNQYIMKIGPMIGYKVILKIEYGVYFI